MPQPQPKTYTSRNCESQFTINPETDLLFMDDLFGDQSTKFCYCDKCEHNHTFYPTDLPPND